MSPFITYTFPSGHVYQVPTKIITDNAAEHYGKDFAPDDWGNHEVIEWSKNNMNWSDLEPYARLVAFQIADMEEGFMEADASADDAPKPAIPIDDPDGRVLLYPVEAIIANLAASQQVASTILVSPPDDEVGGDYQLALTVVQGPRNVVQGYVAVSQNFTSYLRNQANAAAAAADAAQGTNLPTTKEA